ncbi:polysaccharide biosynthesis/export family protein [Aquincola sp. S2]|uniref:Polysaccharide biosynthesis/export family protein n=2 Tax=Pseudaquabacterium terrae TaxID=2732868 RepID=A0ABX2EKD3_9BURK|nr:polysaccharide biosynthesis/export family protein [Aquabacterium terrae]NRF69080.1 polysaccharide biosynthesis/export family protein [Aquabacterium terrae]
MVAAAQEYRLGAGDVIRINVHQHPDLSVESRIAEGGDVSHPRLGPVRVGGQTVTAAERTIAERLRAGGFVQQPQVTIVLMTQRIQ